MKSVIIKGLNQSLFFGARMHITMLIKNSKDQAIQCVIDDSLKADFESLGFVDDDSKLKAKTKVKSKSKAKANA